MIGENLIKAIIALAIFVLVMWVPNYLFEEELEAGANWIVNQVGFLGLCLILLVTDTPITPFPFSATCWEASTMALHGTTVLAAVLVGKPVCHFQKLAAQNV